MIMETKLKIKEIFTSIDGEVNHLGQGYPSIFIRLADCNLNCSYCDTDYKLDPEQKLSTVNEIINHIQKIFPGYNKVTITGGEPLVQLVEVSILIDELFKRDYHVSLETNGTFRIEEGIHHKTSF